MSNCYCPPGKAGGFPISLIRVAGHAIVFATLINASYSLAATIGRLTAQDLNLPVQVYDWDNDGRNEVLYVKQAVYAEPLLRYWEGQMIEPAVSVPTAAAHRFAATATPEPEDEPHAGWLLMLALFFVIMAMAFVLALLGWGLAELFR